jgi:hypothetical protein
MTITEAPPQRGGLSFSQILTYIPLLEFIIQTVEALGKPQPGADKKKAAIGAFTHLLQLVAPMAEAANPASADKIEKVVDFVVTGLNTFAGWTSTPVLPALTPSLGVGGAAASAYGYLFPDPMPTDAELVTSPWSYKSGDVKFSRPDLGKWAIFTPANAGGANAGGYTPAGVIA